MKYIVITYDLLDDLFEEESDHDLQDDQFDILYDYLLDLGFFDEIGAEEEYVPASVLLKEYVEGEDKIEEIQNNLLTFCQDNNIELENLMVAGPTEISTYFNKK